METADAGFKQLGRGSSFLMQLEPCESPMDKSRSPEGYLARRNLSNPILLTRLRGFSFG